MLRERAVAVEISPDLVELLTNREVLEVDQRGRRGAELWRQGDQVAWSAELPESEEVAIALFNLGDESSKISLPESLLCQARGAAAVAGSMGTLTGAKVRDAWERRDAGMVEASENVHGPGLSAGREPSVRPRRRPAARLRPRAGPPGRAGAA